MCTNYVPILYQLEQDLEKVIKNYVEEETTLSGCLFFVVTVMRNMYVPGQGLHFIFFS